jgi:glyoxylase I family protein
MRLETDDQTRLSGIHHVAVICSDYQRSKHFYSEVLGLKIIRETFRESRNSYKLDLALADGSQIELFSFPNPPARPTRPEAQGLRHLAFKVSGLEECVASLTRHGVEAEPVRMDEWTGKRFTFFSDPDGLPLELYEI